MSRTATQLTAAARLLENLARKRDDVYDHYTTERRERSTGLPASTVGDGTPRGTSSDTSIVEAAIIQLDHLDHTWHDIQAGEHLLLVTIADLSVCYDELLGMRLGRVPTNDDDFDQCTRTVPNANNEPVRCPNHASKHTHPLTGAVTDDTCDQCWSAACPICRRRPAETRRKVVVNGIEQPGCEACARRQARHGTAA